MRRLFPTALDDTDPQVDYAVSPQTPWLRANMVSTIDGAIAAPDGRSGGISGSADRALFSTLRRLADAVVVGAQTARIERYQRSSRPVVIFSRSLTLDLDIPLFGPATPDRPGPVVIVAPQSGWDQLGRELRPRLAEVGIEAVVAGGDDVDLVEAVSLLRQRGWRHLLCEGGPSLLSALTAANLVDELCLTTSPLVAGGGSPRILGSAALPPGSPWSLAGLYTQDDFLFARWQADRATPTNA